MANPTVRSQTYQTLLTTTHDAILDSGLVQDQIFNAHPLLTWLSSGNRLKKLSGGADLRQGLMDGKNTTAQWYSGHDPIAVTPQEGVTTAIFSWKQAADSIVYSGLELRQNKGSKTKIADLVKTKQAQANDSLMDLVATGVFSDGTAAANKQMTGLAAMIETTPGTASYAQVPTANTAWRNQVETSVGTGATNLLPKLRTVWNKCKQGKGVSSTGPDFHITTRAVHEVYESLMAAKLQFAGQASGNSGDMGFTGMKFKGSPVEWSDYEDEGVWHMLNSRHICMVVHEDAFFSLSPGGFLYVINQDSFVAKILLMGNLATNNRRKLGKLTGITA